MFQNFVLLQTNSTVFEKWIDPNEWNLSNLIAFIGLIIGIIALFITLFPLLMQWLKQKRLEKQVDTEAYPPDVIKNSTKYYVRTDCSSVDPTQEAEIRHLVATTEDLFKFIDKFLEDLRGRHLLVLADSGMGKTSFVLNYYDYNRRKLFWKRKRIAIVYLGTPKALTQINEIERQNETDLILDAFDEDTQAIENYKTRIADILKACESFRHVIITSRTQFFPKNDEIPVSTGIVRVEPRSAGELGVYELYKVYLAPLTDKQVNSYLKKRYGFLNYHTRRKAKEVINRIPLLSVRPMILSYIPDLIDTKQPIETSLKLYEILIERWLSRESHWVNNNQLKIFSEKLAIDLYIKREERKAERISKRELIELAQTHKINLEDWKLTGRSLLNRDAVGNYKFAHRSIMEYLLIKGFIEGKEEISGIKWTDMMKKFYVEFLRESNKYRGASSLDGIDLSEIDITSIIKTKYMNASLRRSNLNGSNLQGFDVTGCNFTNSSLIEANLSGAKCIKANFSNAVLVKAILNRTNFNDADLSNCNLRSCLKTQNKR